MTPRCVELVFKLTFAGAKSIDKARVEPSPNPACFL
jgi:hypothetical protein